MKPNIGTLNALARITCGFTILACVSGNFHKRRDNGMALVWAMAGAMKVAEGITRFCPMTKLITDSIQNQTKTNDSASQTDELFQNEN